MTGSSKHSIPDEASWDEVPVMLAALDSEGEIVAFNRCADRALGNRATNWESLIPCDSERIRLMSFLANNESGAIELQAGCEWIRVHVPDTFVAVRVVAIEQITEQTRAIDELRERCVALEKLLTLSRQDRHLIGFEIHDGVVQEMTAAQMFLEAGISRLCGDNESPEAGGALQCFKDAAHWLRRSIEGSRQLIHGLQPPELESVGLAEAIRIMAVNTPIASALHFETNDDLIDLDESLSLSIYRIAQEAITNVWKHADAQHVTLRLSREVSQITVEVQDDGKGFDLEKVSDQRYGLKGMRQRIVVFGGELHIDSSPGQGTRLTATLPFIVRGDQTTPCR